LSFLSRLSARYPVLPWLAGVSMMWIWHLPAIYKMLPMAGMGPLSASAFLLSVIHPLSLFLAGFLFCWPLVTPYKACRLAVLPAVLYLGTACVFCSLLGLLIAFAPPAMFGHVSAVDKQIGGLIMWVPCCVLYLGACMFLVINWLSFKDEINLAKTSTYGYEQQ
jgi:cytochrome c oxidase assembly factor CtaG